MTAGDITRDYYTEQSAGFPVGRTSAGEPLGPSMELGTAGLGQRTVIRQYQLSLLSASARWICPGPSQWSSRVDRVPPLSPMGDGTLFPCIQLLAARQLFGSPHTIH